MKRKIKKMSVVDDEGIETSPAGLKSEKKRVICGIYKITNTINGKIYIGQSVDINARWNVHKIKCKFVKYNSHFYSAIRRYGIDNFVFIVICECSKSNLDEHEIYYINYYDTTNSAKGYNKTFGGKRGSFVNEAKDKMSKSGKGRKLSESAIENIRKAKLGSLNPNFGKTPSEYTSQLMSKIHSKSITYDGITYCSRIEMAKKLNVSYRTVYRMIERSKNVN